MKHKLKSKGGIVNENSQVNFTWESLLVGKLTSEANTFDSFVGGSDTHIAHDLIYRNLHLYQQLEKDLLVLQDFANYAWVVMRLKVGGK